MIFLLIPPSQAVTEFLFFTSVSQWFNLLPLDFGLSVLGKWTNEIIARLQNALIAQDD
jgi:hypothetical protein